MGLMNALRVAFQERTPFHVDNPQIAGAIDSYMLESDDELFHRDDLGNPQELHMMPAHFEEALHKFAQHLIDKGLIDDQQMREHLTEEEQYGKRI